MSWPKFAIQEIAPAEPSKIAFDPEQVVWHLTLDQIESNTGDILNKRMAPASEAGSSTFTFDGENVLYSKLRPYLNKVIHPRESGIATTELIPLRPRKNILEVDFLTYYLRSNYFLGFAKQCVAGVKMPRIIMTKFWEHRVPLPPLSEQRRIVEILDQADALRKKRTEADAKAERILPALFYKMFGNPATNPKGLRKEKLGNLIKVKSGDFLSAKNMNENGKCPVYGGNGINGYHTEYMFEKPVIVIGRVGVYCGSIHFTEPKSWVTDNALYVSEMHDDLHIKYLAAALRIANFNQYAGRAGQPLISGSRIYPVEILVPDLGAQEKYASQSEVIDLYAQNRQKSKQKMDAIFATLLYRAFSGDLTAKWREAHMKELLAEMEEQAKIIDAKGLI